MTFGLRAKMVLAFGLLTLISISNYVVLWTADNNSKQLQLWVTHTHQVLEKSEVFLGHLRDTETGQRGFLLTGQSEYLEPYHTGIANARTDFRQLRELTRDNARQQSRLGTVQKNMNAKFNELEQTIQLAQQGNQDQALNIVKSDAGKKIMDAIRSSLRDFRAEEQQLLETRKTRFGAQQAGMRILLAGEALLLIGFIIGIAVLIQRSLITPVLALTRNAENLAAGREVVDVDVSSLGGEDEMGKLAAAFNNMVRTISSTMDRLVTAQKDAEDKEHRLSEIIWSTNVGTWEWNIETDELKVNDRWAEITGNTLGDLEPVNADSWRTSCHPDDYEAMLEGIEKHFSGERDYYEYEVRKRHSNGTWVWVLDRGKVVERSDDGKPLRMSGTNTDISERKIAEKVKSEFISTVSHELRTPLTSIKGSLGLIKSGTLGDLPDKLMSMLDIAYRNSERLVLLINDILDIEKMEAGKMDFQMKPVEVHGLIDEAIEANKGYGEEHGVTFVPSGRQEQILVEGDRDRLMQVLSNLMSNAAKFSPEGEEITVQVSLDNGVVRIAVEDKGPGVPEEFRSQIFEKFSQADSSDTRQVGGTGLGLSITKAIIERHEGTIGFETETGKGSTFYFDLPAIGEISEVVSVVENGLRNGSHILVCEDEADVAQILETMLQDAGFQTSIARTAAEASQMLDQGHFDAMTLDLGLPDRDGISLIRELRNNPKTRNLPIVVVSATAMEGKREVNGSALGVVDWIEKPVEPEVLVERLSNSLRLLEETMPRILHVEDDDSILDIVSALVMEMGTITAAKTLKAARDILQTESFDLVLLDLMLPDGRGETLLPLLNKPGQQPVPVIVFSAIEISRDTARNIEVALIKTRTSNDELLDVIRSTIESGRRAEG